MPVINLTYLLPAQMKQLHPDWKELKGKYAEVLKTKKIVFDKKLGPMLDTRVTLHKQISSFKKGGVALIVAGQLKSYKTNAKALEAAAKVYKAKVKTLGTPASTEFNTILTTIISAAQNDVVWADGKLTTMMTPAKK